MSRKIYFTAKLDVVVTTDKEDIIDVIDDLTITSETEIIEDYNISNIQITDSK